MALFHRERRKLIAEAFFDIFKFVVIGACVGGFFPPFSAKLKLAIGIIGVVALAVGFGFCPDKEDDKDG